MRHSSPSTKTSSLFFLAVFSLLISPLTADVPNLPEECLLIGRVGQYGRAALHTDEIQAQMVAGTWRRPQEGDEVLVSADKVQTWKKQPIQNGGVNRHRSLRGGYAYVAVESDSEQIVLVTARGQSTLIVNGEFHTGDPYNTGKVRVPIKLRKGTNDFLLHCSRGSFSLKFDEVKSDLFFNTSDFTLPDLRSTGPFDEWGAVIVVNATETELKNTWILVGSGKHTSDIELGNIPALGFRKVPFHMIGIAQEGLEKVEIQLSLHRESQKEPTDTTKFSLAVRKPHDVYKRTFVSEIDGSVQYYAVRPASSLTENTKPALVLSCHGAGVGARGQAASYSSRPDLYVVAPTNRRPFGFDWEDWGRLDAMEVLALAKKDLGTDPQKTYLTGHSMGGHGTWHLGVTYPDKFAAIAPSAGWISFWSYGGGVRLPEHSPLQELVLRAATPSDTLKLSRNYANLGVYILHGDSDNNVPTSQARKMKKILAEFHGDFAYYEKKGAGHWWNGPVSEGVDCVDWQPIFDFFALRSIPQSQNVNHVSFYTANPGISANLHWATVEDQLEPLQVSKIDLSRDLKKNLMTGTTGNVKRLALDVSDFLKDKLINLKIDGEKLEVPVKRTSKIWLAKTSDGWSDNSKPSLSLKGPHRYGTFKDAFRHRFVLVYGTSGDAEENTWALRKAKFDAETFWYRGNGTMDMISDAEFDPADNKDQNVILYGNADTNSAWKKLLADSPVQFHRGSVSVGDRTFKGSEFGGVFIRPRKDSDVASVGVVTGSGVQGMRLTTRLPFFVSGVAYPDLLVISPETLKKRFAGIVAAGYFGSDWSVKTGHILFGKATTSTDE